MIKLEELRENECYITDIKYLRGCRFKVGEDITMNPICSYAVNGVMILLCNKKNEDEAIFSELTTGYIICGCNDLNKKEVKFPGVTSDNYNQVIEDINSQNHLWIPLEEVDEVTQEKVLEFRNSIKGFDGESEVYDALEKLDGISTANIKKTVDQVEITYGNESTTQVTIPKNGNKKLGQIAI